METQLALWAQGASVLRRGRLAHEHLTTRAATAPLAVASLTAGSRASSGLRPAEFRALAPVFEHTGVAMSSVPLRRIVLALSALLMLIAPASATWSIVVVNRRTGEVCIASATCIPRLDLTAITPVLLVGRGGGVTQALLDGGENKLRILEGLLLDEDPSSILARIQAADPGVASRQFGIVDFTHAPLSFTGRSAGLARRSVAGAVDELVYAIQGNVLVNQEVVEECEAALRASSGDTAQRVMSAMVRARELGGDGRCSCGLGSLGNCGAPAPDFEKSAHIGFLLVARMGDTDGSCLLGESCANGDYHLRLNVRGPNALPASPDPVDQLVERFAAWRAERRGRPDGLRSRLEAADALPADGASELAVRVVLVDLEGVALTHGGALLEVVSAEGAPLHTQLGPVTDLGDGSYRFVLRAGTEPGLDRLAIRAQDELVRATLYPYLEVRSDPVQPLHVGLDRLSASNPEPVPFVVQVPARAGAKYWLFARLAGKLRRPDFDPALLRQLVPGLAPFFPAPPGTLDEAGRATPRLVVPAGVLAPLIGLRLEWSARVFGQGAPLDTNAVGFQIVP